VSIQSDPLTQFSEAPYGFAVPPGRIKKPNPLRAKPRPSLVSGQGERIREQREKLGATVQDLADALGLSKQQVSRIELGQVASNDSEILAQIADVLGVSRGWLAYGG
jgi:ribosome-binding protein aMBF1 (putative translation factor)